jgi:V8-like Glu-specific endopeptidase
VFARRRWIAFAFAVAVSALPASASAQSPEDLLHAAAGKPDVSLMPREKAGALRRTRAPLGTPGLPLGQAANPIGGAAQPGATGTKPKLTITCKRRGQWRCRVRRRGAHKAVATCRARTKAKARRRCLTKATQRLLPSARSSTLNWQGFPSQRMSAVGRLVMIYPAGVGKCTGTVVSRTLVLAAGHCLDSFEGSTPTNVLFIPGASWTGSDQDLDYAAPYGVWGATHWWTTGAWQSSHDAALDWSLIEFPPADNGQPISAVTGAWNVQPNIRFNKGADIYAVGYPASGYWAGSSGGRGRGQYACSGTWDGDWSYIDSGWELWTRCTMNRGASGGPWFVKLSDGKWVIGGINNRCKSRFDNAESYCDPYADWMRSSYLDSRFYDFWNSVQPLLTAR